MKFVNLVKYYCAEHTQAKVSKKETAKTHARLVTLKI